MAPGELWPVEHSPVLGWLGSCDAVGRVTMVTPKNVLPVSWQAAHPLVMPVWFICVPAKLVKLLAA